ncbi:hypothetical protein [Mycobacterium spongiae]|uniref:hypothetical protein n=1 Tax=Mycobacterium spongiae TaxID=886343 RepID=UPI003CCE5961
MLLKGAIALEILAILLAANIVSGSRTLAPGHATTKEDVAINGTYRATSIGDWAKTNDSYHDEATVVSIWTISSSCTTFQECTGTVSSDQGWTAPTYTHDGIAWYVKHDVPNWEPCDDGTSYTGRQTFYFYPVNDTGMPEIGSPTFAGKDKTIGPSGACGVNKWLHIELPFRLDRIG